MVLSEWDFWAKHIPGSLNVNDPSKTTEVFDPSEEIIV